jgi:hypothetical protein
MYGEWRYSAIVGSEWSDPRTYRFTSGKTAPGTHPLGESEGPRDGLYAVKTWKHLFVQPGIEQF